MSTARFLVGDVFERLASLEDNSVDLVLTSPPFLALRSYLPEDHPDKHKEIGSEPTPAEFIDTMLHLVAELDRVVAPHGSIAFEFGDTYSGSGGSGGDYNSGGMREGQAKWSGSAAKRARHGEGDNPRPARSGRGHGRDRACASNVPGPTSLSQKQRDQQPGWPLAKSLCMIPELFRVALAYGIHPLTGVESPAGRWRVRNVVRWYRPNPPVGALGDKYRPATSDLVIACRAKDRWFDLDAVREPATGNPRTANGVTSRPNDTKTDPGGNRHTLDIQHSDETRPPYDTWVISTAPYKGSHYATFPPELCRVPVLSMCPSEVCTECGAPRRRIAETMNALGHTTGRASWRHDTEGKHTGEITESISSAPSAIRETIGWSECGCEAAYRPGVVLDPFAGTGTTLMVATGNGRGAIGIDLDERNARLAQERLGMFLTIEEPDDLEVA